MDAEELLRQLQQGLDEGLLNQLYRLTAIDADEILIGLRERGIQVYSLGELSAVETTLLDDAAEQRVKEAQRSAAISGASFGLGGWLSIAPEALYLVAAIVRLAQRISLTYGFEVISPRGQLELWMAVGRALGVKMELNGLEAEVHSGLPMLMGRGRFRDPLLAKVAQRVIIAVVMKMGTRATRLLPLIGAGVGGLTNLAFLHRLGRHLKDDFRTQHQLRRLNLTDPHLSESIAFTLDQKEPIR